MSAHKIISVDVVRGSRLTAHWRNDMQRITTDQGKFIDNMPGKQFGFVGHPNAHPGYDWAQCVGEVVHGANVIEHGDYKWLNKGA